MHQFRNVLSVSTTDERTVFVAVVDAGGFSAAARRLGLARSSVARSVAKLERRLGVRLMQRTTRNVLLTDEGRDYHERVSAALTALEHADLLVQTRRSDLVGRLRVTAPVIFGRRYVAPALIDLASKHPQIELQLSLTDHTVDVVGEGFDLAVRNGRPPDTTWLRAKLLGRQRMLFCASPAYLADRGTPHSLDALRSHTGIVYGREISGSSWKVPLPNGQVMALTPLHCIMIDDLEAAAQAAAADVGITCLPTWLLNPYVQTGRMRVLLEDQMDWTIDSHLLWPNAPHLSTRTRHAIDRLTEAIAPAFAEPG